jgi:hypothetical protein
LYKIRVVKNLKKLLVNKGYIKIPLVVTKTNHLELKAVLNGVEGRFILDTGASNTCVGFDCVDYFKLSAEASEVKASGAGATNMRTQISKKNTLQMESWKMNRLALVLFDLTHVNQALTQHDALPVHGILGADVLKKAKAVIDYRNRCFFLK